MSTTTGPTRGAERHTEVHRWDAHPRLARALQIVVMVGPLALSILFTWLAARLLPPARLGVGRWTWVALVFIAANLLLAGLRVASRRLVPLIALLRLTLVFPDNAPSRMKATMRKSNSRAMFREIEAAQARGDHSHEALHGEYAIQLLRDVNEHDRLTRGHSERVRAYSELLGEELGLGPRDMEKLRWGALLHDVGKLSVPSEILNLDGRPSEEEWAIIQGHPGEGGRLLEPLRPWLGDWLHAADQHHCRWDGRGYPLDLAGTDIAFAGRLVAIADAYDTMTSVRSYKKPLSPEAARTELTTAAGSQFDPTMVRAFLRIGLGRLRTVSGPLAWIVNFLGSLQVPVPAGTIVSGGFSAGIASAGLAAATVFGVGAAEEPDPLLLAFQEPVVVASDDRVQGVQNQPIDIMLAASVDADELILTPAMPDHGELVVVSTAGPIEPDEPSGPQRWLTAATYTPMPGYVGRDQVTFNACVPDGPCDTGTVTIVVARTNRPPIARDDRGAVGTDGTAPIRVLDNDRDPDGDVLRIAVVADTPNGRVVVAGGVVEYVPNPGFEGEDTFTYTVTDPDGAEATATVTVTVPVANQPPRARNDRFTTIEEQGFTTGDVTANDTDDQPIDAATVTLVGDVTHGLLIGNGDGTFVYAPDPDFSGTDTFTYTITDPEGATSAPATVTIVVDPDNDPPEANPDAFRTDEDTTLTTGDVTTNDTDAEDGSLRGAPVTVVGSPRNGTLTAAGNGTFTYQPDADFNGTDTFTYTVVDSDAATSNLASVTITVVGVNDDPVAVGDAGSRFTGVEDVGFAVGDVTANDSDPDHDVDPASVTIVSWPANGDLVRGSGSALYYEPAENFSGTDGFTYTITDPEGATSSPASVTITVTPVNDSPVAVGDSGPGFRTTEGVGFTTANVTANDSDVDDPIDPASATIISNAAHGELTDNGDGTFGYTPDPEFNGTDTFTYAITDPDGATSSPATVTIFVDAVNDAPVAVDDDGPGYTTPEDMPFTTADVTANDTDPDGPVDPASITIVTGVAHGVLADNGDGTFTYLPDLDFDGIDTFTYTITDDDGATSNPATVTLTVSATNDAPDAFDDTGLDYTTPEDVPFTTGDVTANDTDVDHPVDPASITIVATTSGGTLTHNGDGTFGYTPDPEFNGTDTFTYTITDPDGATSNPATVTIVVDPVNDPPVANDDSGLSYSTAEDTPFTTGDVTANDTDPDHLVDPTTITIVTGVANGTLFGNGDGTFDYAPNPNFTGADAFTYRIADAEGAPSAPATVSLMVSAVNDAPIANDDGGVGFTITEDTVLTTGTVTSNDSDVEDGTIDPGTIAVVTTTTNGTLTHNGDGTFDYTPNLDFVGIDTFTYTVTDSDASVSNPATVTLVVTNTNDPPVAVDDDGPGFATDEDTPFTTADITANDSDVEDGTIDPGTIAVVTTTTNGTLTHNGDGTFDYTPDPEFSGTDSFTYEVYDSGSLLSNEATVTVVVSTVNDVPVANDDTGTGFMTDEDTPFTTAVVTANDTDVDHAIDPTSVAIVTDVANGNLVNNADGTFTYSPAPDFFGTDSFTYRITDGGGAASDPATVTISVASVNDAPIAAIDTALVDEGAAVVTVDLRLNDSDDDGPAPLAITGVTDGAHGTVVDNGDGTVTYTHDGSETTSDTFTYTLSDSVDSDTSSVQVEINPINDPPVAVDDVVSVSHGSAGTTIDLRLNDTDPENDPLTIVAVSNGANGTVVDNGDGTVTYTHDGSPTTADSFTYTVSDSALQAVGTVDVTISSRDYDAIADAFDNCPGVFNIDQYDTDGDGLGDACDPWPTLPSTGTFGDSGEWLGTENSHDLAFGDLDGDGDLDLVLANLDSENTVWLNDGTGGFTSSGQLLGNANAATHGVAIGDLDGDGDLDLTFANTAGDPNTVWLNDGTGGFTSSGQQLGLRDSTDVALGDFDGDGDLDLVHANENDQENRVWFNDGLGLFTAGVQTFAQNNTMGVATDDLDGDGDLDLVFANDGDNDTVWLNDGTGTFADTGQILSSGRSHAVVIADVDGDGDNDFVIAGDNDFDTVWVNDGSGTFTDSGQIIGLGHSRAVDAGDVDGDGDIDLVFGDHVNENTVWLNDGTGTFTDSLQLLTPSKTEGIAFGDVDGDGDLDVAISEDGNPSRLWLNT